LPSNLSPLGALPARFRRQRVLIVGCGDVGLRVANIFSAPSLRPKGLGTARVRLLALTSSPDRIASLRQVGVTPITGNLDHPAGIRRLAGVATKVLYLAPPPRDGAGVTTAWGDPRLRAFAHAIRLRSVPASWVYASTSGVYGDCAGDLVSEVRPVNPQTPRAHRRVDAEAAVRHFGRATGCCVSVLRIPGIYAPDREGGTPQARLLKGTPVLLADEDVYTNHIHADDLARACLLALWRAKPQRVYNISDHAHLKMGDYFDMAADLYHLPRPPRISRSAATEKLPLMLLSFMNESRRLGNQRMQQELGIRLHYPSALDGLSNKKVPAAL
jgi:nucleoside-diphosphate-sugar epimerase